MASKKEIKITPASLASLGFAHWVRQPTLESGHTDNLKYEDGKYRVWVSRMDLADYGGDRKAWLAERLTVEQRVDGVWKTVWPAAAR